MSNTYTYDDLMRYFPQTRYALPLFTEINRLIAAGEINPKAITKAQFEEWLRKARPSSPGTTAYVLALANTEKRRE